MINNWENSYEGFLPFQRCSPTGTSLPSLPGTVLLRRLVCYTKYDPLVDEVEQIKANPQYALVRHPDRTQATVSLRDLAPAGNVQIQKSPLRRNLIPLTLKSNREITVPRPIHYDDTASVTSPSDLSEKSKSEALTRPDDPDERLMPQKRLHPEMDLDDPYSDSERPYPQRKRYFRMKYFSSRTNRRTRNEMFPSLNNPVQNFTTQAFTKNS